MSIGTKTHWIVEGKGVRLEMGRRTLIMGILNVTPDSFSDGGRYVSVAHAVEHAQKMAEEGADIIDVGGESSRPGSDPVSVHEEIRRVIPVIDQLSQHIRVPLSIDTNKHEVAEMALSAGARILNDISALRGDSRMLELACQEEIPIILMHMRGKPKTMQVRPAYQSVLDEIAEFFKERLATVESSGIPADRVIIDPGIGFGKDLRHNLEILGGLARLKRLQRPILVGPSRKSFLGQILELPVEHRLEGTIATVVVAVLNGASIVRVHDVEPVLRACRVIDGIRRTVPVAE